ncbi:MAG: DUF1203 domain-containing protein [Actinomycetota bacterium]
MDTEVRFRAIDRDELARVLAAGLDHGGNAIEPFVDADGGWTMRCCLTDSTPGDRIALIAWSPFRWDGPYRETGPVVVHADDCPRAGELRRLPPSIDQRSMELRPYTIDRRIAYDHVRHVPANDSVTEHVQALFEHDEVDFVHGRNMHGG